MNSPKIDVKMSHTDAYVPITDLRKKIHTVSDSPLEETESITIKIVEHQQQTFSQWKSF